VTKGFLFATLPGCPAHAENQVSDTGWLVSTISTVSTQQKKYKIVEIKKCEKYLAVFSKGLESILKIREG